MTIDEALKNCEYASTFTDQEYDQLAEWLEDYKKLKHETEQDIYERAYKEGQDKGLSDGRFVGYNKAIDNMVTSLIRNSRTEVIDGKIALIVTDERIKLIAEQLKEGGTDEKK